MKLKVNSTFRKQIYVVKIFVPVDLVSELFGQCLNSDVQILLLDKNVKITARTHPGFRIKVPNERTLE